MYTVVIGVGVDTERALTKAQAIAALPSPPEALSVVVVHASDTPDEAEAAVDEIIDFFADNSIETTVETTSAEPPTALVKVATDHEADLLCVGGREHSPAGKVQLRGGAQSVILNADRPVLVAGEPADDR
jgi:nucleotide-binding universal stress UspA family protein